MYGAFISYNSDDVALARKLHDHLVSAGIARDDIWFDVHRLRPGFDWHAEIEAACARSHVVLPVLTPRWKASPWTRYETYSHDRVIPVIFEGPFIVKGDDGEVDWDASVGTPPLTRFQATAVDVNGADGWSCLIDALREQLERPAPVRDETRVDVPIGPNEWFVGREREMLAIHETLHRSPTAALTQGRVQAISALGGIGKTTLVREYVEVFWRCYPQICWVDCRKGVETEFARIFQDLDPDRAGRLEPQERAAEAYRALRNGPARLLVLDNAEDEQSAAGWAPRSGKCRTLITSRYGNWSPSVTKLEMFEFKPEHSREFLIRRTGRAASGDERAACEELAKALGHLPLALEQAGAYMAHHTDYTFRSYLDFYREAREDLLALGALGTTEYPDSVATTWKLTIAKLSAPARAVLRMASYYADTPIPLGLFRADTASIRKLAELFKDAPAGPSSTYDRFFVDALAQELHGYSMARQRGDSLQVHNLVQVVERIRLDRGTQAASLQAAQDALARYAPSESAESPRTWPVWDELLPHAERLHAIYISNDCPVDRPNLDMMSALSGLYFGKGMYAMSLTKAEDTLKVTRRVDGERSKNMADALLSYGESLRVLCRDKDAVDTFERSLDIREEIDGKDHVRVANVINYLALATDTSNDEGRAKAEGHYRRAIEIYRSQGENVNRSDLIKCLNNLAVLLRDKDDDEEAHRLLMEACELSDDQNDEKIKPQLAAIVRGMLASALADHGDSRAESLYTEALDRLRDFPADHPYREQITHRYARFKRDRHELTEAKRIVSEIVPSEVTDDPIRLIKHELRLKLRVCECVVRWPSALDEIDPAAETRFRAIPEPEPDADPNASDAEYSDKDRDGYTGMKIKGVTLTDLEHLSFDFVIDKGNLGGDDAGLPQTYQLIENFLTCMAVDEEQVWATDEQPSPALRDTHLGRVLTEQSRILKQAVTHLIHRAVDGPDAMEGLAPLLQASSTDRRPVELEVWISPTVPKVYEGSVESLGWTVSDADAPSAFVLDASFCIHLETRGLDADADRERMSSAIETYVIPNLTHWVNKAEPFFGLQRVNNPMVLAAWIKREFSTHPALYKYVNSGKAGQLNPTVSAINRLRKPGDDPEAEDDETSPVLLPGKAVDLNEEALRKRRSGHFDEAKTLLCQAIDIETSALPPSSPKHPHRQNNLALIFLLADQIDESAEANARAWELKSSVCTGGHDMTSARILFVRLALDWLTGADASAHLGQLRTLLNRPELPALGGIQQTWDAEDILDRLAERLASERAEFLRALVNSFNHRERVAELDAWRFWTDQEPVPLETGW